MTPSRRESVAHLLFLVSPMNDLRLALELSETRGGSLPWTTALLCAWQNYWTGLRWLVGGA